MLDSEAEASLARESPAPPGGAPRRRGLRRRGVVLGGTAVLAAGAAGGVYALQGDGGPKAQSSTALPTVGVVRTDMVNIRKMDGTLGYAGDYTVLSGGGRITWLPDVGDVIERGKRVYGVNGRTVPLFYGAMPFWQTLSEGMSNGRDVRELEQNLDALGYGSGMTVDKTFTYATAQAVREWQRDLGVTRTGEVKVDDVVVQPGAIRVSKLSKVPGAGSGGDVLTATGVERVVTVKLPVNDQAIAEKGAKVRVILPGEKTTAGRIVSVGTVASASATNSKSQTGEGTQNATVPVTVKLDKANGAGNLDGAPATVGFSSTVHKNVLVVPVNALLASADGKYSVNAVDTSGAVRSVPVELGIFDGDRVEVSGDLTPGTKVQVPRS